MKKIGLFSIISFSLVLILQSCGGSSFNYKNRDLKYNTFVLHNETFKDGKVYNRCFNTVRFEESEVMVKVSCGDYKMELPITLIGDSRTDYSTEGGAHYADVFEGVYKGKDIDTGEMGDMELLINMSRGADNDMSESVFKVVSGDAMFVFYNR